MLKLSSQMLRRALALMTILALWACDNGAVTDPKTDPGDFPAVIEVVSGDGQVATVNQPVDELLVIRVLGKAGQPFTGSPVPEVLWTVEDELGTPASARTRTDTQGEARNSLVLGTVAGPVMVHATVIGSAAEPASFRLTALPDVPAAIVPIEGLIGLPGSVVTVGVRLEDQYGNPVPNQPVRWGGALNDASTSDENGIARIDLELEAVGPVEISATVGEIHEDFVVQAADVGLLVVEGAQQVAEAGEEWPVELAVQVVDRGGEGEAIEGIPVAWTVEGGAPQLSETSSLTDADGVARIRVRAGPRVGREQVLASIGMESVSFVADVYGPNGAAVWGVYSGADQHGRVGTELPQPFEVRVLDVRGVPVADVDVMWTMRSPRGGAIEGAHSTTDASGIASMNGSLGLVEQDTLVVWATIPVFPDTIEFRAIATSDGRAVYIEKPPLPQESGDGQQGPAGKPLPLPLRVQVLDIDRHPVVGQLVKWRIRDGGDESCSHCGHLGQSENITAQSYTDENGFATMTWSLGPGMGPQYAEAYVPDLAPKEQVRFVAFATSINKPFDLIRPDSIRFSGVRKKSIPEPMRILVVDSVRSPVAGATVSWAVTEGNGVIRYATTSTDESGVAENWFIVGNGAQNLVKATLVSIGKEDSFPVRGTYEPEVLKVLSGQAQQVVTDSVTIARDIAFPAPLRVQVLDRENVPVKNATIVISAIQGGGGVSVDGAEFGNTLEVQTDYDGYAAVLRTANEPGQVITSFTVKGTFISTTISGLVSVH